MGHINQFHYLDYVRKDCDFAPPVLEVGSKDYGSNVPFRQVMKGWDYTGLDIEDGKGVDVVHDLTKGPGPLKTDHYGLIICCSVLEHVKNPWVVAKTLKQLVKPGGWIYLSTPWIQRYHKYPDDYWRFTHSAINLLFDGMAVNSQKLSTFTEGEFLAIGADNSLQLQHEGRKYLPCYELHSMIQKR